MVDVGPFDAIESEPELVQGLLYGRTHGRLLRLTDRITFNRKRPDFHVLFIYAHLERQIADVFRFAFEAVVSGQAVDHPRHSLVGGSLEPKTMAAVKNA